MQSEEWISKLIRRKSTLERNLTQRRPTSEYFPNPEEEQDNDLLPPQTKFMLYPESQVKIWWDFLTSLIILHQSFMLPYFFAFSYLYEGYIYLDLISTFVFLVDILVSFNTAFYRRGAIVTSRIEIAKKYCRLWLWIDVVSTFPYSWVIEGKSAFTGDSEIVTPASSNLLYSSPALLRMLKLARIMSLLRVAKIRKFFRDLEFFFSSNSLSTTLMAFRLLMMMMMICHWIACLWIYISVETINNHNNWIINGGFLNDAYLEIYVSAMYWSITSMASVGYGDIKAASSAEKAVAIVCMVIGSGIFTFIISSIGTLVSKHTSDSKKHRERVIKFNSFMKHNKIPTELKFKVRRYMDYIWEKRQVRLLQENDFLELLSGPLRDAIFYHTRGKVLRECSIFGDLCSGQVLVQMSKIFEPRVYAPSDNIFEEGECNTDMHFITIGQVEILHRRTKTVFHSLTTDDYFGQISFFTGSARKASAHCLEFVETLLLKRSQVDIVAEKYPEFGEYLDFVKKKCEEGDLTALKINCYMCDQVGHAAVDCKQFVLNANVEQNRSKWLKSREQSTVRVNPFSLMQEPNFIRKQKQPKSQYAVDFSKIKSQSYLEQLTTSLTQRTEKSKLTEDYRQRLFIIFSEEESSSDEEVLFRPDHA
jgi:hyperpolarization activated cyclic nucleotide-gated potassium channel 2